MNFIFPKETQNYIELEMPLDLNPCWRKSTIRAAKLVLGDVCKGKGILTLTFKDSKCEKLLQAWRGERTTLLPSVWPFILTSACFSFLLKLWCICVIVAFPPPLLTPPHHPILFPSWHGSPLLHTGSQRAVFGCPPHGTVSTWWWCRRALHTHFWCNTWVQFLVSASP